MLWMNDEIMKIMDKIDNVRDTIRAADQAAMDYWHTDSKRCNQAYADKARAELILGMLADNMDEALFRSVFPGVLSILNKYAGKPIGDKTKDKIRAEAKTRFDCSVWLSFRYDGRLEAININPLGKDGFNSTYARSIAVYTRYKNDAGQELVFFNGNKLQSLSVDMFRFSAHVHEDPEADVDKIYAFRKMFRDVEDDVNKLINDYNSLLPSKMDGLQHVYIKAY